MYRQRRPKPIQIRFSKGARFPQRKRPKPQQEAKPAHQEAKSTHQVAVLQESATMFSNKMLWLLGVASLTALACVVVYWTYSEAVLSAGALKMRDF